MPYSFFCRAPLSKLDYPTLDHALQHCDRTTPQHCNIPRYMTHTTKYVAHVRTVDKSYCNESADSTARTGCLMVFKCYS